jgi:hypothetical protein
MGRKGNYEGQTGEDMVGNCQTYYSDGGTEENSCQDKCSKHDLNQLPPKYKSDMLMPN